MNNEIETSLLISLVILIAAIAFVVWWYCVRRKPSEDRNEVSFRSPGYKDKLTLIDGIGATLEAKLNALGITSFRQIADLTPRDIEQVNEVLRFKGRIEREGWVAQARKLVEAASRPSDTTSRSTPGPGKSKARKVSKAPARKTAGKKTTKKKTATRESPAKTVKKTTGKKVKKKTRKTGR